MIPLRRLDNLQGPGCEETAAFHIGGQMSRRPSPSLVISMLALVVALGGAGYSATGGNFILGQGNIASTQTSLATIPALNGRALQITNASTGANATALGLAVGPGRPPMIVNSAVKVTNLNADRIDGLDSAQLVRKMTIPFSLAPQTATAPIALPADNVVIIGRSTTPADPGMAHISVARVPGNLLSWVALNSCCAAADIRKGNSNTPGDPMAILDTGVAVRLVVNDGSSVRVENTDPTITRTGTVTLFW
jgi:hypothetical protein